MGNDKKSIWGIVRENTTPGSEIPRIFCARIGPLQLGVVLVILIKHESCVWVCLFTFSEAFLEDKHSVSTIPSTEYIFYPHPVDDQTAKSVCERHMFSGGSLAMPKTKEQHGRLVAFLESLSITDHVRIGISDEVNQSFKCIPTTYYWADPC